MCSVDWGLLADWVTAITSAGLLIVAVYALQSWRDQMHETTRHDTAQEVATAAGTLRYAFYAARSPLMEAWEFPETYRRRLPGVEPTNDEQSAEYAHMYAQRWKELYPYIRALIDLRAKCGAVFGDDVAKAAEDLAKKARELEFYMEDRVEQIRMGPNIVAKWNDQEFVAKAKASVKVHAPRDDTYSAEFETAFQALLAYISPHLHP